jgi:hypothetical protein
MQFIVIVGSGVVATFFGPFHSKAEVKKWAEETETSQYVIVLVYPPFAPGR